MEESHEVTQILTISGASPQLAANWRASETLSGVYKFELVRYIYIFRTRCDKMLQFDWSVT